MQNENSPDVLSTFPPPKAPYLRILGDIGCAVDQDLFYFLEIHLATFKIVFCVLGNHEPYRSSYDGIKVGFSRTLPTGCLGKQDWSLGTFVLLD